MFGGGLEVSADLDDSVELVWGFGEEGAVCGLEAGAAAAGATEQSKAMGRELGSVMRMVG